MYFLYSYPYLYYFSVDVVRHRDQAHLQNDEFVLTYRSRSIKVHSVAAEVVAEKSYLQL